MQVRLFKRPLRALSVPVVMAVILATTTAGQSSALTIPTTTLYVSPTGSGTFCMSVRPCSLATAQSKARTAVASGHTASVMLAGGTYTLASTLNFDWNDNGFTNRRVTYQAMAGQKPVFSGGRTVTGWKQYDASKNIWVASAVGISATRALYVNGKRASVASAPASSVFGALTPTSTGYTTSQASTLSSWSNAADQPDITYAGAPFEWAYSLCGISAASGTTITMANPCFQNLSTPMPGYNTPTSTLANATYVENNLALLTQPGQFYVSTASGRVYYIPRAGETMSTASVIAPQLNTLVNVLDATNLTFSGITFSYANWAPSPTQGLVDIQSNVYDTSSNGAWSMVPSAVSVVTGTNVIFSGNTFTHLNGAGISADSGGSNNTITGNVVSDVSATGINLSTPLASPDSGDQVTNNYVHHVAQEYQGGVGIFAGIVAHTNIAHNEVWAVPGTGISLGWGWGSGTSQTDNHVDYNRVHDVNQSPLYDGGAIYLNGAEAGAAGNSSAIGNYISGDPQPYGAIYLEAGASNYNVSSNVVLNTTTNWIYLQTPAYGSPAVNNTISGNYTSSTASSLCLVVSTVCTVGLTVDPTNVWTNNSVISTLTSTVNALLSAAGIQTLYGSITGGAVDTNLSYGTAATGSSTDSASQPASAANDGNSGTAWTSAASDLAAIWQTDLGSAKTLSEVQVLMNQSTDLPASRANFKVVVSNSPISASNQGTTVCAVGSTGVASQGMADCAAPSGTWRYVGVVATGGQQLSLAEVRAFGH